MPLSKTIRKRVRNALLEQDTSSPEMGVANIPDIQIHGRKRQPSPAVNVSFTNSQRKRSSGANFVKDSLRRLHTSEPANFIRREWELETELHQAKHRNATYEEQIRVLTVERDAAEAEVHTHKSLSTYLEQDFSKSTEMLTATRTTARALFDQTDALKAEAHKKDELIDDLQSQLSKRNAMAAVLTEITNEKEILERENEDLQVQTRNLESWIKEVRSCAFEATAYHANLENKLQVCDEIIHELQSTIQNDRADFEMNKKAFQRMNQDLRQEVGTLKSALTAKRETTSQAEPNWKNECLRVHRRHSLQVEQLQAQLRQKSDENERLRIQGLAHFRAFQALEAEQASSAASSPIRATTSQNSGKSQVVNNNISSTTTLVDMRPTYDQVEQAAPSAERTISSTRTRVKIAPINEEVSMESSIRGLHRQRDSTGSFVGVALIVLCLSAALMTRLF